MITFVVSHGNVPIDIYSQRVAPYLPVQTLHVDYFQRVAEKLSKASDFGPVAALKLDFHFLTILRRNAGILHFPHQHFGRFGHFLKMPFLITCHDIIRYIDAHETRTFHKRPSRRGRFYLAMDFSGLRKAVRIIAISRYTKADIVSHLDIAPDRIDVVYPGLDHGIFRPLDERASLPFPYILYVGSEAPRKNFAFLLQALSLLKQDRQFVDLKLLKIGNAANGPEDEGFRGATMREIASLGLHKEVIFAGRVSDRDLAKYYAAAECFVFPSLYEGFGMPPLEAMACGCPVIVSNRTSLPEVVGDAGLQIEPDRVDELTDALRRLLTDRMLRKSLISRGLDRARQFSWEKTADHIYVLYRQNGYL